MKNEKLLTLVLILGSLIFSQVDYATQIQPIFNSNCSGCHIGETSGNLDLSEGTSYNNLVNIVSSGYAPALRVLPGDATNSVIWNKVAGTGVFGTQMPMGGQLTQDEIDLIETWINGTLSIFDQYISSPERIDFLHNYPNPFNPFTTLAWIQEKPEKLDLYVYTLQGQLVEHITLGEYSGGYNQFVWQPENLSSGVYMIQLTGKDILATQKVIYSK